MKTKIITLGMTVIFAVLLMSFSLATSLVNDGSASQWAEEEITSALESGFVPTLIQGNYTAEITREEFCKMGVKWLEYKSGKDIDTLLEERGLSLPTVPFLDTNDKDILAAFALGITKGMDGDLFVPKGQITREQAATMLYRTCQVSGLDLTQLSYMEFADIETAGTWAVEGINFCGTHGIMQGMGENIFEPFLPYTREQSIVTFVRISEPKLGEKFSINSPSVAGKEIPILMYHAIAEVPTTSLSGLFVRPSELREQLQYLVDNGFQTITFEDLENIGAYSKPVMLTFDDGYLDNYEILFPLLKEFNQKATIFVITDTRWCESNISEEQIKEMSESGLVSIQSHTLTHTNLTKIGTDTLHKELSESKDILEGLTGRKVMALAYPGGYNNATVREVAQDENYDYAVTTEDGVFSCGDNPHYMERIRINRGLSINVFAYLVN